MEFKEQGASSRETEPKSVTFVYRGINPLMRSLADDLENMGFRVERKEIPVDTPYEVLKDPDALKQLTGQLGGDIVSDITLQETLGQILGRDPVNAYDAVKWNIEKSDDIVQKLRPIVEEIRSRQKIPVVLQNFLGHHIYNYIHLPDEERKILDEKSRDLPGEGQIIPKAVNAGNYYSMILNNSLDVPIITRKEFRYAEGYLKGNAVEFIRKLGLDPKDVVLMVDHHIYQLQGKYLAPSGLKELSIVPICPCCIGLKQNYVENLEQSGFNVFQLEYEAEKQEAAKRLVSLLNATSR